MKVPQLANVCVQMLEEERLRGLSQRPDSVTKAFETKACAILQRYTNTPGVSSSVSAGHTLSTVQFAVNRYAARNYACHSAPGHLKMDENWPAMFKQIQSDFENLPSILPEAPAEVLRMWKLVILYYRDHYFVKKKGGFWCLRGGANLNTILDPFVPPISQIDFDAILTRQILSEHANLVADDVLFDMASDMEAALEDSNVETVGTSPPWSSSSKRSHYVYAEDDLPLASSSNKVKHT